MKGLREKFRKHEGFTLIEMLIVVAIIAILIAIAIPMVNKALENAREATDAANQRSALGLAMVEVMTENKLAGETVSSTAPTSVWYVINDSYGSLVKSDADHAAADGGEYGKSTALMGSMNMGNHVNQTIKITYDPTKPDEKDQFKVEWA